MKGEDSMPTINVFFAILTATALVAAGSTYFGRGIEDCSEKAFRGVCLIAAAVCFLVFAFTLPVDSKRESVPKTSPTVSRTVKA